MFEAVGLTVSRLMRVRYGPVHLSPRLKRGQCLDLEPSEVQALLKLLPPDQKMAVADPTDAEFADLEIGDNTDRFDSPEE
jgi:hypothetical protein